MILACRGIEQIGGKFAVPHDAIAHAASRHSLCIQGRAVEYGEGELWVIEQRKQLFFGEDIHLAALHGIPFCRLHFYVFIALFFHHSRALREQKFARGGFRQKRCEDFRKRCAVFGGGIIAVCGRGNAVEPEARNQFMDFERLQQAHGFGWRAFAAHIAALGGVDGRIGANRAEGVA